MVCEKKKSFKNQTDVSLEVECKLIYYQNLILDCEEENRENLCTAHVRLI